LENIRDNKDLITEIPPDRWIGRNYYGNGKRKEQDEGKMGWIYRNIDKFDASFFNILQRGRVDGSQQRITLEAVYQALEDAGIAIGTIKQQCRSFYRGIEFRLFSITEQPKRPGNPSIMSQDFARV